MVFIAALLCHGCTEIAKEAESLHRLTKVRKLAVGMPRQQVIEIFGKPYMREDWGATEFLMYETHYLAVTDSGRFTPVAIVNDKVAGWGSDYYMRVTKRHKNWDTLLKVQ